jgi:uncharacterized repeat protein (TIGR03806 family)
MKKIATIILLLSAFVFLSSCSGNDDTPPPVAEVDEEKPTAPENLMAVVSYETSIDLVWDAAIDNEGVTSYSIYQDGLLVQENISGTSATATNLTAETSYNFYVVAYDAAGNQSEPSASIDTSTALTFRTSLSEMGVFSAINDDITPAQGVQLYEINSTLFTDYAKKQRLIRLPEGATMTPNGNDLLPNFPDNTLIAKTFYYNIDDRDPSLGKQIIETRIFLKIAGEWQAADYIWNDAQNEAIYTTNGLEKAISYIDENGAMQDVQYQIPSQQDCFTCHNNNDKTLPIGLKLRSLNFVPSYANQNQLDYFIAQGILEDVSSGSISVLPDWTNTEDYSLDERARAYIDINCAHCHNPNGSIASFGLDFRYETPFEDTGIYANRGEIGARFESTLPTYRMPQLGRTIVHEEALAMLVEYIDSL